ncbi:MAG: hypothetical protein JWQ07_3593 [Ramlibacter sp.]|nr:hypothetical protein [Ramlibacter sp.]
MNTLRTAVAAGLAFAAAAIALPSSAQVEAGNCILAGRLSDDAKWAPRMAGVELLGQDGRAVTGADKQALSGVRQVKLSAPALLSRCDGSAQLALGPDAPGPKAKVPAIGPGVVAVEAVSFPKLRRGGELVELRLAVPADRVVMLTR